MAFKDSLKKLFGTSKEVAEVKAAEFKEKNADKIEEVKEDLKETIEKLDEKAAAVVDKLEVKLRATLEKPAEGVAPAAEPEVEIKAAEVVEEPKAEGQSKIN